MLEPPPPPPEDWAVMEKLASDMSVATATSASLMPSTRTRAWLVVTFGTVHEWLVPVSPWAAIVQVPPASVL